MRQFPYSADVTHWFVFQGGRRDFHLILLVYKLVDESAAGVLLLIGQSSETGIGSWGGGGGGVPLTHERAGDVFRHLVTGATHL